MFNPWLPEEDREEAKVKRTERFYPYLWIQAAAVVLLFLYVFMTYAGNVWNFVWFGLALFVGVMGYTRQLSAAIGVAVSVVLLYGGYVAYRVYIAHEVVAITWSDLTWLLIVPCFGLLGGLTRYDQLFASNIDGDDPTDQVVEARDDEGADTTAVQALLVQTAAAIERPVSAAVAADNNSVPFPKRLDELIQQALQGNERLELLLVDFMDMAYLRQLYGMEQGEQVVSKVAERMQTALGQVDLLIRCGPDRLAVAWIVRQEYGDGRRAQAVEQAEQSLVRLQLDRPRSSRLPPISLNCRGACFPRDGMTAAALLDHAERRGEL